MDKKVLFEALNTELAKENIDLEIICVGGFVLEYYNLRGTQDVDAFYQEDVKIRSIIEKVGDDFDVNEPDELWLNNNVANIFQETSATNRRFFCIKKAEKSFFHAEITHFRC